VPSEIRERIFDPFFTTRGAGMGLGLYVVEGVVRAYGGRVRLTDAAGGGACFEIVLPAAPAGTADTPVAAAAARERGP
jgi:signal transduction histidine kinase